MSNYFNVEEALKQWPQYAEMKYKYLDDVPGDERPSESNQQFLLRRYLERVTWADIVGNTILYASFRHLLPGAPPASELDRIGAIVFIHFRHYIQSGIESYTFTEEYLRAKEDMKLHEQASNPYLCGTYQKTDDKPNVFMSDTFPGDGAFAAGATTSTSTKLVESMDNIFRSCADVQTPIHAFLASPLRGRPMRAFIDALVQHPSIYQPLGINQEGDFRFFRPLATLAGLGCPMAQAFFRHIGTMQDDHQALHYGLCSPAEYEQGVREARHITGYPLSLLRVDGGDLLWLVDDATDSAGSVPQWVGIVTTVHVLKYCWIRSEGQNWILTVCRRGRYEQVTISTEQMRTGMGSLGGRSTMLGTIMTALGLPYSSQANNRTPTQAAILRAISRMTPMTLARQVDFNDRPEIIPSNAMAVIPASTKSTPGTFIDTGCAVVGVATIDMKSGKVEHDPLQGSDALTRIVTGTHNTEAQERFRGTLPQVVPDVRPSDLYFGAFKQIDDLGHLVGMRAMFDSVILGDQLRYQDEMQGTDFANALKQEFPMVVVMPRFPERKATTNTGKSTAAGCMGSSFDPRLTQVNMSRSTSAPLVRAALSDLQKYGTTTLDEFKVPSSPDHPLNADGLQSLSTGGAVPGGICGETAPPITLTHPITMATQFDFDRPDLKNRCIRFFARPFDDENKADDETLAMVVDKRLSQAINLVARRYCSIHHLHDVVNKLSLASRDECRFRAHFALACHLAGGEEEVIAYLQAAQQIATANMSASKDNGMADEHGIGDGFSLIGMLLDDESVCSLLAHMVHMGETRISIVKMLSQVGIENKKNPRYQHLRGIAIKELETIDPASPTVVNGLVISGVQFESKGITKGGNQRKQAYVRIDITDEVRAKLEVKKD